VKISKLIPLFILAIAAFSGYSFVSAFSQKPKVTGTWNMSVETTAGSGSPTFILKQDDDINISGTYSGQLGEAPVKGTIKGNDIRLEFNISGNLIEYTGTITDDTMKGKVKLGSMAEGTFTGKRKDG
jgi:hypothetical protein